MADMGGLVIRFAGVFVLAMDKVAIFASILANIVGGILSQNRIE